MPPRTSEHYRCILGALQEVCNIFQCKMCCIILIGALWERCVGGIKARLQAPSGGQSTHFTSHLETIVWNIF